MFGSKVTASTFMNYISARKGLFGHVNPCIVAYNYYTIDLRFNNVTSDLIHNRRNFLSILKIKTTWQMGGIRENKPMFP